MTDSGLVDATAGPVDGPVIPPASDAASDVVPEPRTEQLPRTPADSKLTRRLAPGGAILVGGDGSSCSRDPKGAGNRWCAFVVKGPDGKADELWALNLSKAVTAATPCDGTSQDCRRITAELWTGSSLWGPSHPTAHRFEDDTLIFHTGQAQEMRPLQEATIWAWRPEWPAPRKLTSDKGLLCFAQPRTRAVVCIENAVIDKDPTSPFDRPRLREFDLLAGTVDGSTTTALPKVARLVNVGGDAASRLRLSTNGEYVGFSRVPAAGATESVEIIKLAEVGKAMPTAVATDAADWEIAHDGKKLYYLAGLDRSRGERATGTLMLADFPSGANATELAKDVVSYELLGSHDEVVSDVDRGLVFLQATPGTLPRYILLRDRAKPADVMEFTVGSDVGQVATDVRHTLYFREPRGASFPVAYVARNDGSGFCQLTTDIRAETYGGHFTDSGRSVFWIEYGRGGSESEEGWYARPETCGEKTKFGDFVLGYRLFGEDFVVFDGGDLEDTTSWLQYTALKKNASDAPGQPWVIKEKPDPVFATVRTGTGAGGEDVFVIFSTSFGGPTEAGLYVHGPLRSGSAAP